MGLPFRPEPYERLSSRLSGAFQKTFTAGVVTKDRAGLHRSNVFDTDDGIRLIISKELLDGKEFLHISGSREAVPFSDQVAGTEAVLGVFKAISGLDRTGLARTCMTPAGVVHLVYELDVVQEGNTRKTSVGGVE